MKEFLLKIMQKVWETECIPTEWEENIIIPLHKKGDTTNCENYRAICLSSVVSKLYTRIREKRLRIEIETRMEEEQAAFRPNRQTQDHIFSIRCYAEKALDKNKSVYLALLDLTSAFDIVPKQEIWKALEEMRVTDKLRRAIQSVYKTVKGRVRICGDTSDIFYMSKGLKQGDSLSPLLFNILMNEILRNSKILQPKTKIGHYNLAPVYLQCLVYADDIMIITDSEHKLQEAINVWNSELEKKGMKLNKKKSKLIAINKQEELDNNRMKITCGWEDLEWVNSCDYLGVRIQSNGKIDNEITNRINKASKVYHSLNHALISKKEISKITQMQVYNSIYKPTLT